MDGLSNSKELFRALVDQVHLQENQSEVESIVMLLLEERSGLTRSEILGGKPIHLRIADLADDIRRINDQEPVQYIVENAHFFGREFFVNNNVLIPRPETETLIEEGIRILEAKGRESNVLDIGTGSGCIAITLALETNGKVTAIDISESALDVADTNARSLGADVQFFQSNFLQDSGPAGEWDLIVSNPPYVRWSERSQMKVNVTMHEPHEALFVPDDDALIFYKRIAAYAKACLKDGGTVIVEINENLGEETVGVFEMHGFRVQILKDLGGKNRVVKAWR